MNPKSLPAKAARDVPHEQILREAPHKPERDGAHIADDRAHFPAKAAFKEGDAGKVRQQPPRDAIDQQPPVYGGPRAGPRGGGGEYYVRFTVRVDNGELSVVDSHVVDGPLAQTTAFNGPYAYEVVDGSRLLHAGSIPDLGTVRAFANMEGTLEQHRHHGYRLETYEFDVRVPGAELARASLANVAIILHRVKAPDALATPTATLAAAPLATQRSETFREIGRVVGIPTDFLTPDLRSDQPPAPAADRTRGFKQRSPGQEGEGEDEGGGTVE